MKQLALVCVVVLISGCNWDDAQRVAECRAGMVSSCDGGLEDAGNPDMSDAGTPDAGAPDAGAPDAGAPDAGAPDAGAPDAGVPDAGPPAADAGVLNPNHPVAPRRDIVGLFPRGDAGAVWLVLRSGEVRQLDSDGGVDGSVSFPGEIIDAYADGVAQPLFAALVTGGTSVAIRDERAATLASSVVIPGRWVTTFDGAAGPNVSVWDNSGNNYSQTIIESDGGRTAVFGSPRPCGYEFADLQVMRFDEGDAVVLAYESSGCDDGGIPPLPPDAGLSYITRVGGSGHIGAGQFHRLGRLEGEIQRGFVAGTMSDGERVLQRRVFAWSNSTFTLVDGGWALVADAGLTLGDVSGNVVSGVAYGPIAGPFAVPSGFVVGTPTAFVASDTWAVALGPTLTSSHVPVLRVGGRVFVAWLDLDGGVRTRVLSADNGGP